MFQEVQEQLSPRRPSESSLVAWQPRHRKHEPTALLYAKCSESQAKQVQDLIGFEMSMPE